MLSALVRVFEITGCTTQLELANLLEIRQSSVSDAKRRGSVPAEWLVKLLQLRGANPEWIISGEGSKFLIPSETAPVKPNVVYLTEIKPPAGCSSQELVNELVKRALSNPDLEEVKKQVIATWLPIAQSKSE